MSILIRDMEMPKNCYDCFAEAFGYCRALKYNPSEPNFRAISDSMTRREDCPLIELPRGKWSGKWNWIGFNIECSECGAMPNFDSTEPLYNFCPNCGAKMTINAAEVEP